jgi:hypothetical protein
MNYADDFLIISVERVTGFFKNSAAGTVLSLILDNTSKVDVTYDTAANRDLAFLAIARIKRQRLVVETNSTLHGTL